MCERQAINYTEAFCHSGDISCLLSICNIRITDVKMGGHHVNPSCLLIFGFNKTQGIQRENMKVWNVCIFSTLSFLNIHI